MTEETPIFLRGSQKEYLPVTIMYNFYYWKKKKVTTGEKWTWTFAISKVLYATHNESYGFH